MKIQKVQIISNHICYGPGPRLHDEVEQHLTIARSGRIWFSGYSYGNGKLVLGRRIQYKLESGVDNLLALLEKYMEQPTQDGRIRDVGFWSMAVTDLEKQEFSIRGSLIGGVCVDNIDLTEYIRKTIRIERLNVNVMMGRSDPNE